MVTIFCRRLLIIQRPNTSEDIISEDVDDNFFVLQFSEFRLFVVTARRSAVLIGTGNPVGCSRSSWLFPSETTGKPKKAQNTRAPISSGD